MRHRQGERGDIAVEFQGEIDRLFNCFDCVSRHTYNEESVGLDSNLPDEFEHVDDYCLVALKVLPDGLREIARDWHPEFENYIAEGGGGGKEAYIELNLYQIHPDAHAVGLIFKHAEGNEFEENSRAEIELFIIENQMFESALYAELEQYSYSYSYGEEESSSSSEMWTDITLSDELYNGFYNLILTHHYRESEHDELIRDDEQTNVYQWVGTGYSKGN